MYIGTRGLVEQNGLIDGADFNLNPFPDGLCDGLDELPGFLRIPWPANNGSFHIRHNDVFVMYSKKERVSCDTPSSAVLSEFQLG